MTEEQFEREQLDRAQYMTPCEVLSMNEQELQQAYTRHCEVTGQTKMTRTGFEDFKAGFRLGQPAAGEPVEIIATLGVHDYFPNSGVSRPDLDFTWVISPQRQRELVKTIKEPIKLVALNGPPCAPRATGRCSDVRLPPLL